MKANTNDTWNTLLDKINHDLKHFNGYAIEVIYNIFGEPLQYYHIPFQKVCLNKDGRKVYFKNDWNDKQETKLV